MPFSAISTAAAAMSASRVSCFVASRIWLTTPLTYRFVCLTSSSHTDAYVTSSKEAPMLGSASLWAVWAYDFAFDAGRYVVAAVTAFLVFWVWGRERWRHRLVNRAFAR